MLHNSLFIQWWILVELGPWSIDVLNLTISQIFYLKHIVVHRSKYATRASLAWWHFSSAVKCSLEIRTHPPSENIRQWIRWLCFAHPSMVRDHRLNNSMKIRNFGLELLNIERVLTLHVDYCYWIVSTWSVESEYRRRSVHTSGSGKWSSICSVRRRCRDQCALY